MPWIDLMEKLPELGQWVLGLTNATQGDYERMGGGIFQIRRIDKRAEKGYERLDWMVPGYVQEDAIFTHWMPLPNFPKKPLDKNLYLGKHFKFPEDNSIEWSQDFCYYSGDIPHNITFELTDFINNDRVVLRAKGYGLQGTDNSSDYGNGSIFSSFEDIIPFMIED